MTFDELYLSVKKKFSSHPEIMLKCETLTIQIIDRNDRFSHAFYILWKDGKCILDQYHCDDYDIWISGTQAEIELLFKEKQYLLQETHQLEIEGSFHDVMLFQKLLSYITNENTYTVQQETISELLSEQAMVREDLGIVMQTLQLLLANSLISLPETVSRSNHGDDLKKAKTPEKAKPAVKKSDKHTESKSSELKCGQLVKLNPKCKIYYDNYHQAKRSIYILVDAPHSKVYSILSFKDSKCELCFNSPHGTQLRFLVEKDMVIPVD